MNKKDLEKHINKCRADSILRSGEDIEDKIMGGGQMKWTRMRNIINYIAGAMTEKETVTLTVEKKNGN